MKICFITVRNYAISTPALEYDSVLTSLGIYRRIIYGLVSDEIPLSLRGDDRFVGIRLRADKPFVSNISNFIASVLKVTAGQQYDLVHVNAFRGCSLLPWFGRKISRNWIVEIRSSNVGARGLKARLADRLTAFESTMFARTLIHSESLGHYMLGDRPFVVTPSGADLAKFEHGQRELTRRQLNFAPDDIVIIYTGTLRAERNPFQILAAFAEIAPRHPKSKLLIVGDSNLLSAFQSWAETRHLADRVIITGRVPYENIQDYVAAADIGFAYVPITPNYDYNPPLKTAEFLAAGLPTVATDTAGNRMYIRHEENGLIAADDAALLAHALERLITDPELTMRLRACARQSVMAFDWRTIVMERLLPVYREYASD